MAPGLPVCSPGAVAAGLTPLPAPSALLLFPVSPFLLCLSPVTCCFRLLVAVLAGVRVVVELSGLSSKRGCGDSLSRSAHCAVVPQCHGCSSLPSPFTCCLPLLVVVSVVRWLADVEIFGISPPPDRGPAPPLRGPCLLSSCGPAPPYWEPLTCELRTAPPFRGSLLLGRRALELVLHTQRRRSCPPG